MFSLYLPPLKTAEPATSTLAPALSGRWDKQRRFDVAWQMIRQLNPQQWITQRAALTDASTLYQQIHNGRADLLQAVFTYPT